MNANTRTTGADIPTRDPELTAPGAGNAMPLLDDAAYRSVFEQAADAIVIASADGRIERANPRACAMFGYAQEEFAGLNTLAMVTPACAQAQTEAGLRIHAGASVSAEREYRRKDGSVFSGTIDACKTACGRVLGVVRDSTAAHQAAAQLRASEQRFRDLVDSTDGIVWEADAITYAFVSVSGNAERMLGYPVAEWLQPGFWAAHVHPEDRDHALEFCDARTRCGEDHEFEYRFIAADGRGVWLRDSVRVVMEDGKPRWQRGLMTDITAHKQAQAALIASEAGFRAIIDASPVPLALNDEDQRIVFVNPAFTQTFGYTQEDIPTLADWWPKAYPDPVYRRSVADRWRVELGRAKQSGTAGAPIELHIRAKDGSDHIVLVNGAPLAGARRGSHLVVLHDVTERKQLEQQALQSEKLASLGLLAAGVAHEINNPIAFVNSNLGSLKRGVADLLAVIDAYEATQAAAELVPKLWASVNAVKARVELDYLKADLPALLAESGDGLDRVKRIVQELREFSRTSAVDDWQPHAIVDGIESTFQVLRNELKYKCEVRKDYAELPLVECVLAQLNQVFMNLLVNAAQAIEEHGTITVRTGCSDAEVWVEIADSGCGIAPEHLPHVFDPFYTTKDVGHGTGLGLSVSHTIVKRHHGRIEVESALGKGSIFRLYLPIRQPGNGTNGKVAGASALTNQ